MALAIFPKVSRDQGVGGVKLNGGHPSAAGLLICVAASQGAGLNPENLARSTLTVSPDATFGWKPLSTYGNGFYFTGGNSLDVNNPQNINAAAGDFTVRLIHHPDSWGGGFVELIAKGSAGRELNLFADTNGNLSFYGVGTATGTLTTATGMTAGKDWDLVWTRIGSLNTAYVNGFSKGTWTDGATTSGGTAQPWVIGRNQSGGGQNYDGKYALFAYWNRGLTSGEVMDVAQTPFGLLLPQAPLHRAWQPAASVASGFQAAWAAGASRVVSGGYGA